LDAASAIGFFVFVFIVFFLFWFERERRLFVEAAVER
jgi:hypothetical protein